MALSEEDVMQALRDCYDPEIPVNIVDLGLIYKVVLTPDANSKRAFPRQCVEVEMTMTSQGCVGCERSDPSMRTISAGRFFDGTTTETDVACRFMLARYPIGVPQRSA